MSEVNNDQADIQYTAGTQSAVPAPQKRIRPGFIFLAIVPVAVLLFIQSMCQVPFMIMTGIDLAKSGEKIGEYDDVVQRLMEVFTEKYAFWSFLLYAVIGLIVFGIWYRKGFVKKSPKVKFSQVFGVKSVIAAIGSAVGLNLVISAAFTLAYMLFPAVIEAYNELMESSGLGNDYLITIVYAIILGPIVEEICLRGLTFGFLEKSGIKPVFVILISGVLFGAMHMNLVQGIYASVLGFLLGFLRYRYRSIMHPILTHILFNIMGTFGSMALEKIGISDGLTIILGGFSLFVLVGVIVLVNGDKKAYKQQGDLS